MIGNIFTGEGIGATFGNLLISPLLERTGGHTVISAICHVLLVVIGLVPSCSSFQQVVLLYVIVGSCLGMLNVTVPTRWPRGCCVAATSARTSTSSTPALASAPAPLRCCLCSWSGESGTGSPPAFFAIAAFSGVPAFGAWLVESAP